MSQQYGPYARFSMRGALPLFSQPSSAEREKYASYSSKLPWFRIISPPMSFQGRRLHLCLINPRKLYANAIARFGRKINPLLFFLLCAFFVTILTKLPLGEAPTLVFKREDLQRIWNWEISSGHYPSRRPIPEFIQLKVPMENPGLPSQSPMYNMHETYTTMTRGTGAERIYIDIQSAPAHVGFPPRPMPGSIIDFDVVMKHCAYEKQKFVRDCLEILRVAGGLDNGRRVRRGKFDDWKYIYSEQPQNASFEKRNFGADMVHSDDSGLRKHRSEDWETPPIFLRLPPPYISSSADPSYCDPESPRIFHMYWTGEFTDKPYLALLSFLFTQNTGLHYQSYPVDGPCRTQFWMWINPGPAASVPNPTALDAMYHNLNTNPWSSPFLHPRFQHLIHFKLWNTTEQLDGVPELKDEWRSHNLFTTAGRSLRVPSADRIKGYFNPDESSIFSDPKDIATRAGSKSSEKYDKLSVILSDMARFILCHRFGGIYLDADTIFLRDWEEIWGWKGAFAYRWSRLPRYNTAVLHLNKKSALGSFLFRTALKNKMDFHPSAIWNYVKHARLSDLLLRLPDALFDSAWLTTEDHLMRPPYPFFTKFEHFFNTPSPHSSAPQALGFEGFFRGAYSYHYHNNWWKPFDTARNWPDLGPRFIEGENLAKRQHHVQNVTNEDGIEKDESDLGWATVLKRVMESFIRGDRPNMYGEMLEW